MLDEAPRLRDGAIITPTVAKSIFGQAVLQLGVMGLLLGPLGVTLAEAGGDSAAAQAAAAAVAVGDHGLQYTLVFNSFVFMQLFNQVGLGFISQPTGTSGAPCSSSCCHRCVFCMEL